MLQSKFSLLLLFTSLLLALIITEACNMGEQLNQQKKTESGMQIIDGGWHAIDPTSANDAGTGIIHYEGEAEIGVKCGENSTICSVEQQSCCVALELQNIDTDAGLSNVSQILSASCIEKNIFDTQCASSVALHCDDAQLDCLAGQACCAHLEITGTSPSLVTSCVAAESCVSNNPSFADTFKVCTNNQDCDLGQFCCGANISGTHLPLDLGLCQLSCELSEIPAP